MAARRRTIARKPQVDVPTTLDDYLLNRSMRERSTWIENKLKAALLEVLAEAGEAISDGRWTIEVDPVTFQSYSGGKPVPKVITGIERRERKTVNLDQERTLAFLRKKDLEASCTDTIIVVNEDAVLAANYSGQISDKELEGLYTESSTFAFHLIEGT